jgi:hypothetical protein
MVFEEFRLIRYNAVQSTESQPTFQRNMSPPSSRSKDDPSKKPVKQSCFCLLHAGFYLASFFDTEDEGNMFLRNVR